MSASSSGKEEVGKWAEQYRCQPSSRASSSGASSGGAGGTEAFMLPLMTLSKCKMPTESVPLQIFEPRYRLMFKLVNQSASRRFGVVLADKNSGLMESVGALCELTHFVTVPERRRLFINARVIGRFQTQRVVSDKPFLAGKPAGPGTVVLVHVCEVLAAQYGDQGPQEVAEQLQLAALEQRVWDIMQDIKGLAGKLFLAEKLGNDIFSLETRRWSPDAAARAGVATAAGADPTLMRMVEVAGLLGDAQTMAERTTEYLCSDALREVSDNERRERFSFALSRTLDFGPERLQHLLYTQDTAERLRAVEEHLLEGRAYLAARSTLRDMF
ncbi:hypothetical protein CHLNCDRAFT_144919 [Chlorella variabilis]|uniref:Lon N-terminal domain-containing protein n=1 Tax=Chlorella variabilis TaxID=554065 RepID=E1ZDA7_CHLVA|nr:hypothetical protein CHLNCDRAFT_144919 [Chlorella variabilis]EFN56382.1 hypothetical protein CHLNCDRAFT_144919 [Chlorella variabilis]|eukprot:XP_005848484.1 hypothetical protein CHLNCDRAFT_144919 [Chlorella variabilis]